MNILKIKQAAEIAKSRTSDKRWLAAIDKAVAGVESGWWIITELAHCLAITTETFTTVNEAVRNRPTRSARELSHDTSSTPWRVSGLRRLTANVSECIRRLPT